MLRVSIVVPCRNEAKYIRAFLDSVVRQEYPPEIDLEMIVADGESGDGTREILREYTERYPWIRVLDNPERVVSSGLNRAITLAAGAVIIRMDVHAQYAEDYVAQCLAVLAETGADNVGGPARTRAQGYMQRAISAAYHSPFACGGARFHNVDYQGPVDTVTFGCWRKEVFDKVGLFDGTLVRNQDDEHNLRLIRAGGRIFQSPRIRCWYETRSTLQALASQYYQYGFWKMRVIKKHGSPASFRHLVPALFVGSVALMSIASLRSALALYALALILIAYALANLSASVITCRRQLRLLPVMPFVLATYHVSYGCGFLVGLFDTLLRPERPKLSTTSE